MANFYSMFGVLAVGSFVESDPDPGTFDMLSRLPVEMALTIFRLLPAKDLLNAVLVSKKWFRLCKSDPKLRQKVRRHFRRMRRARLAALRGEGVQTRGRARDSPPMKNLTNHARPSRVSENRMQQQPGVRRVHRRLLLPYQRDFIEKPKMQRNLKIVDFSTKKLRI